MIDGRRKILLLFGIGHLDEILAKGNVWYVRFYESYFDQVCVAYLLGGPREPVRQGRTTLVSLARGQPWLDLLLAPYRLVRLAAQIGASAYVTADFVFSWWTAWLVRVVRRARVYLVPVCIPEQIYASSKRSLSGLPIWLERLLVRVSFRAASRVWTAEGAGSYVALLSNDPRARGKLVVTDALVDSLPTPEFFERLESLRQDGREPQGDGRSCHLMYVGRLHREKLVGDLIDALALLAREGQVDRPARLTLVGDGPERAALEAQAEKLGLGAVVRFAGAVPNAALPDALFSADIFVSPLTGTALREAALCGLPIVAYDMDWVSGLLRHEETALLVAPGDIGGLAREVLRLVQDEALRERLSRNMRQLAWRLWSPSAVEESLRQVFGAADGL